MAPPTVAKTSADKRHRRCRQTASSHLCIAFGTFAYELFPSELSSTSPRHVGVASSCRITATYDIVLVLFDVMTRSYWEICSWVFLMVPIPACLFVCGLLEWSGAFFDRRQTDVSSEILEKGVYFQVGLPVTCPLPSSSQIYLKQFSADSFIYISTTPRPVHSTEQ